MLQRKESIDNIKGFLTILMILSHICNVCIKRVNLFSQYVNLTTFSGFMFCFGYVSYKAYMSKHFIPYSKLLLNSFKIFFAYGISTCTYCFFYRKSLRELFAFLIQLNLAGYAEFLVSWAYLYLMLMIFIPIIKKIIDKGFWVFLTVVISLIFTKVPYDMLNIPWLGPIIGRATGNYFPLVQYSSYFLIGAYFAKYKIIFKWKLIFFSSISFIYFVVYTIMNGLPMRWKPHMGWIIGGYLFIYLYYLIFEYIEQKKIHCGILNFIGKHSLYFLIVSNFFVFLINYLQVYTWEIVPLFKVLLWYTITMVVGIFLIKGCKKVIFNKNN